MFRTPFTELLLPPAEYEPIGLEEARNNLGAAFLFSPHLSLSSSF